MSTGQQLEIQRNLAYYCKRFSELKVSSNRKLGEAHYKPILLLSIIDLITQGVITDNQIIVSDQLIETFNKYWDILASGSSYKGGLHYPFFHLQSDGFWRIISKPGFNLLQPKTTNKLKEAVEYAIFDEELFDLLLDSVSRTELIDTLVAAWFSLNRKEIEEIFQVNQDFQDFTVAEIEKLEESENINNKPKLFLKKSVVRNAFFRKAVVHIYDYRCAFCKLKVTRYLTQNIVDGAHIKPFSQFFESRINNGISLCKNHHWAFDQGWFGINDEYRIIVASDLQEESPNAKPMQAFQNEHILLPGAEKYFPSLEAVQWHRQNVFREKIED